ncbi:GtrA family protein [Patescibacteria group bacterium AH-259-L07]|nr:GtrA family protein [Patescibacteria group bacterium AH-259-L07]
MRKFIVGIKKPFHWTDRILRVLPIFRKRQYLRQLTRFAISGTLFSFVDFGIYIFLTRIFLFWQAHYLWANFISMSVGAIGGFILNKHWVFNYRGGKIAFQYLQFWIVGGIGGMVFYQALLAFFVESAHIYDIIAKAIAAVMVMFFRFSVQKFWIFK